MKLVGLLSFYDEPVPTLLACIASLAEHGVDELVAVDGAYGLYPGGRARSHPDQHAAIVLACRELGMSCTLHAPRTVWRGNEVEKRTFMFSLAWATARDGDWFWVMDADQVVLETPTDHRRNEPLHLRRRRRETPVGRQRRRRPRTPRPAARTVP
jgi:hypothetical protein